MNDNKCLYCGTIIPEGRQLCPICEMREKGQDVTVKTIEVLTEQTKKAVEEARRETARKIFQELYDQASSNVSGKVKLTKYQIEQLAEKYGV